jgi:NADP-reducing hydrogenase subunit HndB
MIERDLLLGFMKDNPDAGYKILSAMLKVVGNRFERLRETADQAPFSSVKVIVHMGTCGIAAGARGIMKALLDEISRTGQTRIKVSTGGCIGRCASEPNVTVEIQNEQTVIYQKMDAEKIIRVFNEHLILGRIQNDLVLEGGR